MSVYAQVFINKKYSLMNIMSSESIFYALVIYIFYIIYFGHIKIPVGSY